MCCTLLDERFFKDLDATFENYEYEVNLTIAYEGDLLHDDYELFKNLRTVYSEVKNFKNPNEWFFRNTSYSYDIMLSHVLLELQEIKKITKHLCKIVDMSKAHEVLKPLNFTK